MTREACISDPWLIAILVAANLVIAVSYIWMPVSFVWIRLRLKEHRQVLPFSGLNTLFALFILACATTHLTAALVFFRPAFYLEAFLCSVAAIISSITAALLWKSRRLILQAVKDYCELSLKLEHSTNSPSNGKTV